MRPRSDRSRFTLVLLVLASLTAITLDFRGGGAVATVRAVATDALAPVRSAASAVFEPARDALSGVTGYAAVADENARLRARIEELEGEALMAEDARAQLDALLEASDLARFTSLPTVAARVVGVPVSNVELTVQLDRGSDDGLRADLPVVTGAGLVGRIVEVSRTRSAVRLVTDRASAVGARASRSGDLGVVEGAGAGRPLALGVLDAGPTVAPGDLVVTSGVDDSIFPGGIPIGRVTSVARAPGALAPEAAVEPTVDLGHLRFVRVLLTTGP